MKRIIILILEFLAGLAGNLVAGWIQQDVFLDVFTPIRILGTIVGSVLMLLLIFLLEKNRNIVNTKWTPRISKQNQISLESNMPTDKSSYDIFISHASEDKDNFVRQLVIALQERGISVWFDEFEIKIGDSLRESVDKGLAASRFGIVVLSEAFLNRNWPMQELNGLFAREIEGQKIILPIWHGLSKRQILEYSPMLADKYALSTEYMNIPEIVDALEAVIAK